MKTKLVFIQLFLLSLSAFAQKDSTRFEHGMTFCGTTIIGNWIEFDELILYPSYEVALKKHALSVGPLIRLRQYAYWYTTTNGPYIEGGKLTYKFCPNGRDSRFSFHFKYDGTLEFERYQETLFNGTDLATRYTIFGNYLGYGFLVKLTKQLRLEQSISIGYLTEKRSRDFSEPNDQDYVETRHIPSFLASVGLNYVFTK